MIAIRALAPRLSLVSPQVPKVSGGSTGTETKQDEAAPKNIHHIPREHARDIIEFFRAGNPRIQALLDLIHSEPFSSNLSTTAWEGHRKQLKSKVGRYLQDERVRWIRERQHERRAQDLAYHAISKLPGELYRESAATRPASMPDWLKLHVRYAKDIRALMTDTELVKYQTYSNLMAVRYCHKDAEKRNPAQFWIDSRQLALIRKKIVYDSLARGVRRK